MFDDAELLRRYATDRSEDAFTELVQRHLSLVHQAALRRTNGQVQLAEEVAQSVFLKLAQNAAGLQQHAVLAGWLYVATRHAAATAMRTEQRRKAREQEAQAMNETSTPGVGGSEWERLRPELDSVMDELGEADRDAILLRFFENRAYAEIGRRLRISEDAARMRVDRALDKLRALLGRRGIKSAAAALGGLLATQSAIAAPAGLAATVTGSVFGGVGVATATAGGGTFIAIMTTNKIVMGIVASVALVAGGTAVYEFGEARQAKAALATMSDEEERLRAQLGQEALKARESASRAHEAELEISALRQRLKELETAQAMGHKPSDSTARAIPKPVAASFSEKMNILYASPEYIDLRLKSAAAALHLQYGPLYRKLGLSEAKIREFEGLMLDRQQALFDTFAAAIKSGVSIDDPTLGNLNDPGQAAITEKLRALLGSSGYAQYLATASATTATARLTVEGLASSLYYTAEPLSAEQGQRLTQLIADHMPKPSGKAMVQSLPAPDWPSIYAQAREFLKEPQVDTLRTRVVQTELDMQLALLSDRLLQEAAAKSAR